MSADRARDFLGRIEVSNVGAETLDQLITDVRRLVVTAQQPLPSHLGDLVATHDRAFTLLEGHQRPEQTGDLYLLAGITCGLMAYASQDLGALHDAMTQARTGYACADNAGHDGLRAWTRGIQSLIAYYSGRLEDSLHYAQSGAQAAARSRGCAPADPASLATPPLPSPGAAQPRRPTPSGSPSTHWMLTPQHRPKSATLPNPASPLFKEARYLLAEEPALRDKALYHSVLAAVAEGNNTRGAIARFVGRRDDALQHPLTVLEDAGLLRREPDSFRASRSRVRITEPLITFYHAVMRPEWVRLERPGQAATVWADARARFNSAVLVPHFEQLCRDWAGRFASDATIGGRAATVTSGVVNDVARRRT